MYYLDDAYLNCKVNILPRECNAVARNGIRISSARHGFSYINQKEFWGKGDMPRWLDAQKNFDAICWQLVFLHLCVAARSLKDITHIL